MINFILFFLKKIKKKKFFITIYSKLMNLIYIQINYLINDYPLHQVYFKLMQNAFHGYIFNFIKYLLFLNFYYLYDLI